MGHHLLHFNPAGPRGRIANRLVREGKIPTARTINETYADQLGRKPLRSEELAVEAHLLRLSSAETKQLLKFVAKVRRQHKHGPTWNEVAQHMGWCHAHTVDVIRHLGRAQLLTYTWTERSLRIYRRKTRSSPTPIPRQTGSRSRTHPRVHNGPDNEIPATVRTHETVTTIVGAGRLHLAGHRETDL